jgi:hypothetical protein
MTSDYFFFNVIIYRLYVDYSFFKRLFQLRLIALDLIARRYNFVRRFFYNAMRPLSAQRLLNLKDN